MAGMFETILTVLGAEGVVAAVNKCWESAKSQRVAVFLSKNDSAPSGGGVGGLYDRMSQLKMAVVVQRMVAAEKAGVMFTENPNAGKDEKDERRMREKTKDERRKTK